MTVYVDDMQARYGRMLMCHMIADSDAELHAMADRIGIARRHFQGDHYDICKAKKAVALRHGAIEITRMQLGRKVIERRRAISGHTSLTGSPVRSSRPEAGSGLGRTRRS